MPERIPLAAILAGGKGRRMGGRDKARMEFLGAPLIERVFAAVEPLADRVIVVGGGEYLIRRGVPTIPDRFPGASALGGIATALAWARENVGPGAWVLCLACDMPWIRREVLNLVWSRRDEAQVVVPRVEAGYEPLCALYRESALEVLVERISAGDLSILRAFPRLRTVEVGEEEVRRIDPDLRTFLNLNRPGDIKQAEALATETGVVGASAPGSSLPGVSSPRGAG
ncbi:MAG: molybdenum cofactor guanylyltransferase [Deltaproteobacteria bacterium]|nr:molybdenum cofactor guanylyltransferase [Deltaproteobacteria bacterium]